MLSLPRALRSKHAKHTAKQKGVTWEEVMPWSASNRDLLCALEGKWHGGNTAARLVLQSATVPNLQWLNIRFLNSTTVWKLYTR